MQRIMVLELTTIRSAFFPVFFPNPVCWVLIFKFRRQKQNTRLITGILSCILLVWIWKKICQRKKGWFAHMILVFLHSLVILFIILESWWVTLRWRILNSIYIWNLLFFFCLYSVDASHPWRSHWISTWMAEKITVHIQRGKYWQVRSSCTSSPERGMYYTVPFCLIH